MTTPVFCCGVECGQQASISGVGQHWTLNGTGSISTGTVRNGARSLRLNPTAGLADSATPALTSSSLWVARVAIRFTTLPGANADLITIGDGVVGGVAFKQSDSSLYPCSVSGGVITFGAGGFAVTTGAWYVVDLKYDGTANTMDVQVNATPLTQHSNAALTGARTVIHLGNTIATGTYDVFFDDILVSQTSADYPIGDGYVNHFVPTSDGTHTATTTTIVKGTIAAPTAGGNVAGSTDVFNWVNGVPLLGGATDNTRLVNHQTAASTLYAEVIFGPAPGISTPTTGPRAVEVITADREATTATGDFSVKLNDNGTESVVIARGVVAGVITDRYATKQFATAPSTGVAWTSTRFNALRVRFGYASDATPDQYWRGVMVEAEFAAVAAAVRPAQNSDFPTPVGWNPATRWQQVFHGWIKGTQLNLGVPERPPPGLAESTAQHDWPNPSGWHDAFRIPSVLRNGHLWPTQLTLGVPQPAVQSPFGQDDWPNPVRSTFHIGHQGFIGVRSPYFPFPNALPDELGATNDQPNPIPRDYRVPYAGWTNKSAYFPLPQPEPTSLGQTDDQPVPLGWSSVYRNPATLRDGWVQGTNYNLLPIGPQPFAQDDWPNPLPRDFRVPFQGWANKPAYFPPPNAMPFERGETNDQPNPLPRDHRVSYQGFVQPNRTLGIPSAPFGQDDWPNPIPRDYRVAYQGFVQPNRTLGIAVQPAFHQTEWPNPLGWQYRWPAVIRDGFIGRPGINLLPPAVVVVLPFRQLDWPNPRRRSWVAFVPPVQPQSHPNTSIPVVPSARIVAVQTDFPFVWFSKVDCAEAEDLSVQFSWQTYTGSSSYSTGVRTTQSVGEAIIAATSVSGRVTMVVIEVISHA